MHTSPTVSVIIPAYNASDYIAKAIDSVLQQTFASLEVIVVDDASTDSTVDVVKQFDDPRIRIIVNEKNLGAASARNRALDEAVGQWIAVLDADDWYAVERLEKMLTIAQQTQAVMVADDLYFIQEDEPLPWSTLIRESGELIQSAREIDLIYFVATDRYGKQGLHLGLSKPLIQREFLIKHEIRYDDSLRMGQDFWFYLKCLISGARFILEPYPYYFYRSRAGSLITQSQVKRLDYYCQMTSSFLKSDIAHANPKLAEILALHLATFEYHRAYHRVIEALKQKQWSLALQAMVKNPMFFVRLFHQAPTIVLRRVEYHLLGNKRVYAAMYQRGQKRQTMPPV